MSGVTATVEHYNCFANPEAKQTPGEYDMAQAKAAIKQYFDDHDGEIVDYADLLDHFEFPLPLIVAACEELEKEGKISGVD